MFDMHRKWTIVLVAIMTISLSLLWQKPGIATQPQGSFSVSGEAKQLAAIEKDYFNKRVNNDWKGIYQYQNPRFKEKVSAEELEFFEGRVVINYRSDGHISGGLLPSKEYIKANPRRHDALGFPRTMQYKWYFSSHINVKDYILEEYKMDFERPWVDYWEKVNGQWKVALLKRKSSISGVKVHYFVPNEIAEWDKKDFIQISAEKLALNQKP
jgi:hypothetical protein